MFSNPNSKQLRFYRSLENDQRLIPLEWIAALVALLGNGGMHFKVKALLMMHPSD